MSSKFHPTRVILSNGIHAAQRIWIYPPDKINYLAQRYSFLYNDGIATYSTLFCVLVPNQYMGGITVSLSGKNRALFSYKHDDRSGSIFQYKNFEKTKSYNSKFMHAKFIGTSLRSAHMKYCNFDNCLFDQVDFVGSNMRGSSFIGARFIKCTFVSAVFEKANFKNATFENCYWVATSHANIRNFPEDSEDIMILTSFPSQDTVNPELLQVIESLRKNDIIRRSHTLHGKKGKINTISLLILNQEYTDDELIQLLPKLSQLVTSQFYTLSYLQSLLKKAKNDVII